MNLSERDGGLPPDSVVQDEDAILADSERLVDRYHRVRRGSDDAGRLAPCSPFSVTTALMKSTADLVAKSLDVRLHTISLRPRTKTNSACELMANAVRSITSKTAAGSTRVPGWPMAFISVRRR